MRVGIYLALPNPTTGGAERTVAVMAEALRDEHAVEIIHHSPRSFVELASTFSRVDLAGVAERRVGEVRDAELSAPYDFFAVLTHYPPPVCHARRGLLRVLFPHVPKSRQWPWNLPAQRGLAGLRQGFRRAYHDRVWRRRFAGYQLRLANSRFTAEWTRRRWEIDCDVLYPPVDLRVTPAAKTPTIVSVGRFTPVGVNKRQVEMVEVFRRLVAGGDAPGLEYCTVGGFRDDDPAERDTFDRVCGAAAGAPVQVLPNLGAAALRALYERSRIFWHAAGLGDDEETRPERSEHFGAVTVEAMAAGCVPVVIRKGGQPEIVEHGVSGFLWDTVEELAAYTRLLLGDGALCDRMAAAARLRAQRFGRETFDRRLLELVRGPGGGP